MNMVTGTVFTEADRIFVTDIPAILIFNSTIDVLQMNNTDWGSLQVTKKDVDFSLMPRSSNQDTVRIGRRWK